MNIQLFKKNIKGTISENKFLRNALIASLVINGAVGIGALSRDAVVTIIPPAMSEQAWLDSNAASQEYTEAWALYIADRLGNVTPTSAEMVTESIAPLLAPDIYQDVVNAINEQVNQIRQDRVVLKFEPREVLREANSQNKFFVVGRSVMQGPNGRPERTEKTYEIEIKIHNYKPVIEYVTTYSGGPKTEDVVRRETKATEAKSRMEKKNHE